MIYASVYFTMLYKDSQKLEKTRKHRKPMPHNQGVAGSCPAGTTNMKAVSYTAFFHIIKFECYGGIPLCNRLILIISADHVGRVDTDEMTCLPGLPKCIVI